MLILIIFVRFLDLRLVRDKVVAAFSDTKAVTLSEASRSCALEQIVAENIVIPVQLCMPGYSEIWHLIWANQVHSPFMGRKLYVAVPHRHLTSFAGLLQYG